MYGNMTYYCSVWQNQFHYVLNLLDVSIIHSTAGVAAFMWLGTPSDCKTGKPIASIQHYGY